MQDAALIINMNYLGDALMTTPAVRLVKRRFPDARIDVVAGSTANYGALEILALDPDIDRLIPRVDGGSFARGLQLFRLIQSGRYDIIIVLPSLPFYNFIAQLAGGHRVITMPKAREDRHMADHMLDVLQEHFPDVHVERQMVMDVPHAAWHRASSLLSSLDINRPIVSFNVGASRPQKRWPATNFVDAVELCLLDDLNVVLLGGANDQDLETARRVVCQLKLKGIDRKQNFLDLVGKTSLEDLSGVIAKSQAIVTADTGAMHIAAALKVPLVALFGSTSPDFTGPYGGSKKVILDLHLSCAPCGTHPTCGGRFQCMSGIKPEQVVTAMKSILQRTEVDAACKAT
jgi:lipopolysaccharide heptosyltransferase II